MTDYYVTKDLARHGADKAMAAVYAVMQLADDPVVMAQIALMAASACIGSASGCLVAAAEKKGQKLSKKMAMLAVIEIMRVSIAEGPDAAAALWSCRHK
jgi:hypothetical protein